LAYLKIHDEKSDSTVKEQLSIWSRKPKIISKAILIKENVLSFISIYPKLQKLSSRKSELISIKCIVMHVMAELV
jgi:hypothetical protein